MNGSDQTEAQRYSHPADGIPRYPFPRFGRNEGERSGAQTSARRPICKICKRQVTRRVSRKGFLQEVVLYKLGFAPWECVFCRKPFLASVK